MATTNTSGTTDRVRRHRMKRRARGYRVIQLWVKDTRTPDFAAEARRQSAIVNKADSHDTELADLMDAAFEGIDDEWKA